MLTVGTTAVVAESGGSPIRDPLVALPLSAARRNSTAHSIPAALSPAYQQRASICFQMAKQEIRGETEN